MLILLRKTTNLHRLKLNDFDNDCIKFQDNVSIIFASIKARSKQISSFI